MRKTRVVTVILSLVLLALSGGALAQGGGAGGGAGGGGAGGAGGGAGGPGGPGGPGDAVGPGIEGHGSRSALAEHFGHFSEILRAERDAEYWARVDQEVADIKELMTLENLDDLLLLDEEARKTVEEIVRPELLDDDPESWQPNTAREILLKELAEQGIEPQDLLPQGPFRPEYMPADPSAVGPAVVNSILAGCPGGECSTPPEILPKLQAVEFLEWSEQCGEVARRWKARLDEQGTRALEPARYRTQEEIDAVLGDIQLYDDHCLTKADQLLESAELAPHVGILVLERSSFPLHCAATRVAADEIVTARHCIYHRSQDSSQGRLQPWSWFRFYVASDPARPLSIGPHPDETYPGRFDYHRLQEEDRVSLAIENPDDVPFEPLPILAVETYDSLFLYSHQTLAALGEALERRRRGESDPFGFLSDGTWTDLLRLDRSPICAVLARHNDCVAHGCQTQGGISGAPLFTRDPETGAIGLAAVHTRYRQEMPVGNCDVAALGLAPNGGIAVFEGGEVIAAAPTAQTDTGGAR